jgi:protein SCO1/2
MHTTDRADTKLVRRAFTLQHSRARVTSVRFTAAVCVALAVISGCARERTYELRGQVLAVNPEAREITIKHEDIRGFMPSMTMPFKVRDARLLQGLEPGELIAATLVVEESDAYLSAIRPTGHAPVALAERPPGATVIGLRPGEEVPDAALVDQHGRVRRLSEWRGAAIAVTFIYTRCPLPDYCPTMDRRFREVQRGIAADAALAGGAHLLSVTFDPAHDTPAVLAAPAARAGTDPRHWTLLTGDVENIDRFASNFGVTVVRPGRPDVEIVHNLRTAVIGRDGRLIAILSGNEWQPDELLTHLRNARR